MVLGADLKQKICSLFEVIEDEQGIQRVVTPLEFPLSGDRIVVRIRPHENEGQYLLDENGDAAFYASMVGGDTTSDAVARWSEDLRFSSPVTFDEDKISVIASSEEHIAPYIFRVAEAAQQLFALSTSRVIRQASDFKARLAEVFEQAAREFDFIYDTDVELPIAGGMRADFVVKTNRPLIVIAANSLTRLLEAEIIHMQYQLSKRPGNVVAVAESQTAVGKKQFERANYFTDKTVSFDPSHMRQLLAQHVNPLVQH